MGYRQFWRQVMSLALPVAVQSALVAALGMADVLMVSHLGNEAVAAVGLSAKLNFVLILVMAAIGTGCSIMVAQYFGAGRRDKVRQTLACALLLGTLVMLPFTLWLLGWSGPLIRLGSSDPNVVELGTLYLTLIGLTLFTTQGIIVYESAMRSIGRADWPLKYAAVAILLNIALNYWLINGGLGLPALGVTGAAIATVLARLFQFGWILWEQQQRPELRLEGATWRALRGTRLPGNFIALTWPLVANFTLWSAGSLGYHLIAGRLGTVPLAVMSLLAPIEGMYHAFFFGLVSACGIMIGQRLGRDQFAEARWLAHRFLWIAPLGSLLLGLMLLAASPLLLGWMQMPDADTAYQTQLAMVVMCLGFWVKVFNMTAIQGILRSGGDSRFCLGMDMVAMWVIGLPLTWLAAFFWELPFVWVYAMVLSEEVVKALGVYWRIRKGYWLANLTEPEERPTAVAEPAA
ncbi:MATE family efflux transporter [Zobellella denitrificans]|uniref:MATE family efflux transporter n=1 Tax=Zobellella denitrificans TaxID=347534 RepID=UPI000B8C4D49|nr:MATE family efflux transporter [Zobellella denitrificans]OXS15909.1 MATE family efflux transporter [Zobellella denitrificans]